jgi:hypothetical protein
MLMEALQQADEERKQLLDAIEVHAPGLKLKKNLNLADIRKVLQDVTWGAQADPRFVEKRKTDKTIGLIEVDLLEKIVVYGRNIHDIMNADEFADQVANVPNEVREWTTEHMQTVIATMAGRGQINPSPTGSIANQNKVCQIVDHVRELVVAHRALLQPVFDPTYVVCDFSHGGADNLRGPPEGWMAYITKLQAPAASVQGSPVWPTWHTAPPAAVGGSNGLFVFDQGKVLLARTLPVPRCSCNLLRSMCLPLGTTPQQLDDAHSFQGLIRGRFVDAVALHVISADVLVVNF